MKTLPLLGAVALILIYATLHIARSGHHGGPFFWLETTILGVAFFLMRPATAGRMRFRNELPRPLRVVLGCVVVAGIFYGARVLFNEYYSPLAHASNGVE